MRAGDARRLNESGSQRRGGLGRRLKLANPMQFSTPYIFNIQLSVVGKLDGTCGATMKPLLLTGGQGCEAIATFRDTFQTALKNVFLFRTGQTWVLACCNSVISSCTDFQIPLDLQIPTWGPRRTLHLSKLKALAQLALFRHL